MFKNNLKIAWRNLIRNRSHALINILGLAIGIACCLLILLWVADEMSYDKWNEKASRIYRVAPEVNFGAAHKQYAVAPAPLAAALKNDFPEVEASVRFRNYGSSLVKVNVHNYKENNIIYTDSTLFHVFSLKMIKGNAEVALIAPNSLVINQRIAQKYFPNEDPLGKVMTFDNQTDYTITGIIENMPSNSHFNFDFFVSLAGEKEANDGIWISNNFQTYYVLRAGVDVSQFEAKVFPHLLGKYIGPQLQTMMGKSYEDLAKSGAFIKYHFQPLRDIHLNSDLVGELGANGNIQYVWIFLITALFILFIAGVNFMNLSTASSSIRAKEIGVRKVLGSLRSDLVSQFLVESFLLVSIAFFIGIMLAQVVLPYYNNLTNKELALGISEPIFWLMSIVGIILIGILAGSYPAFYLSAFAPIKTLKGKLLEKGSNFNLRNSLVVFQFLIAVLLIVGTIIINQQMNFIQNKKLGYERDKVLILNGSYTLSSNQAKAFKEELLKNPKITHVSVSGFLPVPSSRSDAPLCKTAELKEDNCVSIQMWKVDDDYIPTLGMELVAGRNFSAELPTDSSSVIINETAAKLYGFENPIGQKVFGSGSFDSKGNILLEEKRIIGVVKDFHFESLRQNIGALSFLLSPNTGNISIKTSTDQLPVLISEIEQTWKKFVPAQALSYHFLDDSFNQVYRSETRISRIFGIFSGLSIFIACLGLFGLAAFATERRFKEIGIRKVLGASTVSIIALLSKDFLKLVVISFFIAIPLAWYYMNNWLENFAYHVNIEWWVFLLTAAVAITIAFLTVSFQSVKAALANPVKSLRSE
ncbi:MAG TPA: ABC transporter permease [Bacteroidetes bacterium]|nr:ABC transporter permease [Bacteroidota bacterium]